MLYYAALLGLASAAVQLPFTWDRPDRARRLLPWALVLVFSTAGVAHWIHASYFDFYLPAGINRRLIKAALWLSLAAVISFYTALLHSVQSRPYGVRSRVGFLLISIMAVYVVVERREAFRPIPEATPRATVIEDVVRPTLLVVGIPGATLDAVLPLAQQDQLPFFSNLLEEGAHGRLETLSPTRPRPLWTSLATGRYPYQHGVVSTARYPAWFAGPEEYLKLVPVGIGFDHWGVWQAREEGATSQTLALWEMVERLGLESTRIGWPVGPPIPEPLAENALPGLLSSWGDLADDDRRKVLKGLRSDLRRVQETRLTLDGQPGRAHFVSLDGLDEVAGAFYGGWSASNLEGSTKKRDLRAARIITGYYAALDSMLAEMWRVTPEPRLIALVSPYGSRPPNAFEQALASVQPERSIRGYRSAGPDGLLILQGPGIRPGQFLVNTELTDVAPTLLYALGLPVARDLDGRTITEAMTDEQLARRALTFVPSYETLRSVSRAAVP